jgi:hypothetical protein
MDQKVGLTFYELTVHEKGKPKELKILNKLSKKHPDIFEQVKNFLKTLPAYNEKKLDVKKKVTLSKVFLEGKLNETDRQISGLLRHGHDGYSSTFFDTTSGAQMFKRKPQHVELMPFYFLGDFELGKKSGILCFQTFGINSVGGSVRDKLEAYLNKLYDPEYKVCIRVIQVGVPAVSGYLKNGKVKEVTATRYYVPADNASDGSEDIKCSYVVSPRKRGSRFLPTLNNIFSAHLKSGKKPNEALFKGVGEFLSINISDFNKLEFVVDLAGKERKIDLWDLSKSATKFDITEDVTRQNDGHPTFDSVNKEANDILEETVRKIIKK